MRHQAMNRVDIALRDLAHHHSTPAQHRRARRGALSSRQILGVLVGVAVVMAVIGAIRFWRYTEAIAGDPHRIAVAPFDLPDSAGVILPWRVGLAAGLTDRLSGGGGGFTTVPQAQIAQLWAARPTPIIAAVELARRTAAGLALYGRVDREPSDTLILRAAVINANTAAGVFEVAIRVPPSTDLAHATDTLAAVLLARLEESAATPTTRDTLADRSP